MLKEEFEYLVGKYVSYETYEMYNRMYMRTDLAKEDFVNLLNKDNVKELEACYRARLDYQAYDSQLNDKKYNLKHDLLYGYINDKEYRKKLKELNDCKKIIKEAIKNLIPKNPLSW